MAQLMTNDGRSKRGWQMADDELRTYCDLPDNSIPDCVVEVCSYLDADTGKMFYSIRYGGNRPMTTYLGLLHMAQVTVVREFEDGEDD